MTSNLVSSDKNDKNDNNGDSENYKEILCLPTLTELRGGGRGGGIGLPAVSTTLINPLGTSDIDRGRKDWGDREEGTMMNMSPPLSMTEDS